MVYLEEQGFDDFDELSRAATAVETRFRELKDGIKGTETRMGEIKILRTHIIHCSMTREVNTEYRKAASSKKYLSEHERGCYLTQGCEESFC